ncbi:MAG: hypothetical protein EXR72_16325 [Myxococcales bacterium]|nr:hypothetical protein [Myxococcales bacterium]
MRAISLFLFAAVAGCGASHTASWETKTAAAPTGGEQTARDQAVKEGDDHWAKRDDRAELEAAIASWEKAVAATPGDGETEAKLARGIYLLADGHMSFGSDGKGKYGAFENDDAGKQKYLEMHERGMAHGERALVALAPDFKKKVEAGTNMEDSIDSLDVKAVPGLYWYTTNLGKWANAQGFTTVLKYKSKIKKFIEKCMSLDEHYFYSAPHRYLGVIYAKAPAIAGGDMVEAKKHFDLSLANSPNYLATRVLWAEFYAVKAEDKEGFKRELDLVLKTADDVVPEITAETRIEKRKAQSLMAQIDEKF